MTIKLIQGDCLQKHEEIESGSVDLILTDLPYGTIGGLGKNQQGYDIFAALKWDVVIHPKSIMQIANRILRKNGKAILFAQQPFTTELINNAIPNLPFCFNMIWEKDNAANCLSANKAPVNYYEDVLVFSKRHDGEGLHPLRSYFKDVIDFIGLNLKQINANLGHRRAEHTFYVTPGKRIPDATGKTGSTQFSLCTEQTYSELIDVFSIDKMPGFKGYPELKETDNDFNNLYSSTFNLKQGEKAKSNILKYKKDYDGFHPTQKPTQLLGDLIRTFSNEGDMVVDLTMGSGSTGVACRNFARSFIGIELDATYFKIADKRINEPRLF